ncbi:MAG TPA: inositol monophosphatase family protein [Solirubrobacteraceae bacterium]|nr:inositol monophosphatase family protein [Solirubrobacteraceae bacterium]
MADDELLEIAEQAARRAGELLAERFRDGREPALHSKTSPTDLVSEADLSAEREIRTLLARRRPEDGFLGEESGEGSVGASGLRWVVDPLDGTINFLFGIPQWCVSVAVQDAHQTRAGVVYDPLRDELFCATADGAARLNGDPIQGSERVELASAMVATGFAYEAEVRVAQAEIFARLIGVVRDVRRFGSAALDLCWTAASRYDAYFERSVRPWDVAAGALVCRRAGLQVTELAARPPLPLGILAAPERLTDQLVPLVGG